MSPSRSDGQQLPYHTNRVLLKYLDVLFCPSSWWYCSQPDEISCSLSSYSKPIYYAYVLSNCVLSWTPTAISNELFRFLFSFPRLLNCLTVAIVLFLQLLIAADWKVTNWFWLNLAPANKFCSQSCSRSSRSNTSSQTSGYVITTKITMGQTTVKWWHPHKSLRLNMCYLLLQTTPPQLMNW
jgi:hypothetical protein